MFNPFEQSRYSMLARLIYYLTKRKYHYQVRVTYGKEGKELFNFLAYVHTISRAEMANHRTSLEGDG